MGVWIEGQGRNYREPNIPIGLTHSLRWITSTFGVFKLPGHYRSRWFGGTSIACGGMPTIPRIFEQRTRLGELKTQKLAARFHELIRAQWPTLDVTSSGELSSFTRAVVDDPESLLTD